MIENNKVSQKKKYQRQPKKYFQAAMKYQKYRPRQPMIFSGSNEISPQPTNEISPQAAMKYQKHHPRQPMKWSWEMK